MPFYYSTSTVLLLGLLLSACTSPQPVRTGEASQVVRAETVAGVFEEAFHRPQALTERVLVEQLGPPVRVRMEPVEDTSSATDSMRTLVYHGMEFILNAGSASSEAPLARLVLTDARFTSPEGLRVGYDQDAVRRSLGPPAEQTLTHMIYTKPGPPPCTLVVYLEGRNVSRLEWVLD